ncbi:MAG: hypothetical protein K2N01_10540 [Lachnospiraceae bacterium]|nr:hypothetical protein [Lachnospiraceae bacterium]
MSKKNEKIIKYRRPYHMNIGIVVFVIILIYVLFHAFTYFTTKHIRIYEVTQGTIAENHTYQGFIIRQEQVVTAPASGYLNYFAGDNSKTAWNNLVYSIDETGKIHDQLTAAPEKPDLNSSYFKGLKSEVAQFMQNYDNISFYDVYSFKEKVNGQITGAVSQNALSQMSDTVSASSEGFHLEYAGQPGLVSYYTDGYESVTLDTFSPSYLQPLDYEKKTIANNSQIEAGDPVYKLITSEDWNIIFPISEDNYQRLLEDTVIEIKFKKDNTTCWVNYELRMIEDAYYMVLFLHNHMIRFAGERYIDLELLLDKQTGLKIPTSSITEKSFYTVPKDYFSRGGDSNSLGLYVQNPEDKSISFVPTAIYNQLENVYFIDEDGISTGTVIRKPDSNDTYTVNSHANLTGVYNVNKGYAVFKQIDILFQNEEYAIVRPGMDFGISLYDHIALEGGSVAEDDLIN